MGLLWGLGEFLKSYTFVLLGLKGTRVVRFVCWVTTELWKGAASLSRTILELYIFINVTISGFFESALIILLSIIYFTLKGKYGSNCYETVFVSLPQPCKSFISY